MNQCFLADQEIQKLDRDLRLLIATDGTLTRMLSVVANDEIMVQIINQKICPAAPTESASKQLPSGRVLQRRILLRGRSSGTAFVAAESLVSIDLLPSSIVTSLVETDRPIGEIMAANCLETFKEAATVWTGELPSWVPPAGCEDSRPGNVARRYRVIGGGRPVIIITEYFLQHVFSGRLNGEPDRSQFSRIIDTRAHK